ncbi:hypothetical protein PIB30_077369 [Stylosanthes scabra]|uniref:Uncharacterized protein n=1 Tax=Stylosanthes scabra TaxID=79078 RepID=A0ABU6QRM8_9FABA|nr:hypothetical protein [Stylosanthes scabra]
MRAMACMGRRVVITIHPPLPAAITFAPEFRLTHRLHLHEACSVLFDSIPMGSMQLSMISEAYELATPCMWLELGWMDGILGYSMGRRKLCVSIKLGVQRIDSAVARVDSTFENGLKGGPVDSSSSESILKSFDPLVRRKNVTVMT